MQLKAQISVEHSVLLLIVLALLVPIMSQLTSDSEALAGSAYENIINLQAKTLIDAIERAPLLGKNSQQTVILEMPDNLQSAELENTNVIIINIQRADTIDQFIYKTDQPIVYDGVISSLTPGKHKFSVKAMEGGVCLTYDGSCGEFCGNNVVEGTELCDGTQVFSDCVSQGYPSGGTLLCNNDCDGYITDFCEP